RAEHIVFFGARGLCGNSRVFGVLGVDLASRCRVVCVDVVGRGASDWLEHKEDYGFPLYLSDTATLIALIAHTTHAVPLAKFIQRLATRGRAPFIDWVGTSMGGLLGMMRASRAN